METPSSTSAPATALSEKRRVLRRTGLLDSPVEEQFDKITAMVGRLLRVPVALVSLVDEERQFFKSAVGVAEPWATRRETPLTHSFCQYVVMSDAPLQVNDARLDPLVRDNLAVEELGVIAYLGMPIRAAGVTIGSLCAIDGKPRVWTSDDFATLRDLAMLVDMQIAMRTELWARLAPAKRELLVALADDLQSPLEPARRLAVARAGEAGLAAEVRADFASVVEAIARQAQLIERLRAASDAETV